MFFFVFFRDFSKFKHLLKVLLGLLHRGELDVNPIHVLLLSLILKNQCLVINVHNRLGHGPNHQLQSRHFQGRGILDVPDDALGGGHGALPRLGHANRVNRIARLVLGVPGLGGGQGHNTGRHNGFGSFGKALRRLCFVFLVTLPIFLGYLWSWAVPGSNDIFISAFLKKVYIILFKKVYRSCVGIGISDAQHDDARDRISMGDYHARGLLEDRLFFRAHPLQERGHHLIKLLDPVMVAAVISIHLIQDVGDLGRQISDWHQVARCRFFCEVLRTRQHHEHGLERQHRGLSHY